MIYDFIAFVFFLYFIAFFLWGWVIGPFLYLSGALEEPEEEESSGTQKAKKLKGRDVPVHSEYDPEHAI
tara:strand:- start:5766 stop:5972 length:207 start_codon:yes stop_codon:yes gene_type:complete